MLKIFGWYLGTQIRPRLFWLEFGSSFGGDWPTFNNRGHLLGRKSLGYVFLLSPSHSLGFWINFSTFWFFSDYFSALKGLGKAVVFLPWKLTAGTPKIGGKRVDSFLLFRFWFGYFQVNWTSRGCLPGVFSCFTKRSRRAASMCESFASWVRWPWCGSVQNSCGSWWFWERFSAMEPKKDVAISWLFWDGHLVRWGWNSCWHDW